MDIKGFLCLVFIVHMINGQTTYLDTKYRSTVRQIRNFLYDYVGQTGDDGVSYEWNLKRNRVQKPIPKSTQFFCDVNGPGRRSPDRPTDVNQLRPGDIDVIAAMGDSLTAGSGAMATNILQVLTENKGIGWSIGGKADWRKFLTLPNIIKEFNPNLYGYAEQDSLTYYKSSKFNVAEIGAMSRDIPHQAKNLILRMRSDPHVDINNDWKLVTMMIGSNDFCSDMCYNQQPEKLVEYHRQHLLITLRLLKEHLPRTIVNLVVNPTMVLLLALTNKPPECESYHRFECPCFFSFTFQKYRKRLIKIMENYRKMEYEFMYTEEFQNTTDFTVVSQPFLLKPMIPVTKDGTSDYTYLSKDCFHLSQKAYALLANSLWYNMLEPVGNKSTRFKMPFKEIKCPTEERPFIATVRNSAS